jgi:hypothetical protein
MYNVDIDVTDVEDDGLHMFRDTYEKKIHPAPISLEPTNDTTDSMDVLMEKIYNRTKKWVEWIVTRKKRTKGASAQATPEKGSSPGPSSSSVLVQPMPQILKPVGGGDQPPEKDKEIDKTCQDGSVPVTKPEVETEKKKSEEGKLALVLVPLVQTQMIPASQAIPLPQMIPVPQILAFAATSTQMVPTPVISPVQVTPMPVSSIMQPAITQIVGAPLPSVSTVPVLVVGGSSSSSSEASESDEEEETSEGGKQIVSALVDTKNPFSSLKMSTPVKKKMFSVDTIKKADNILSTESWLESTLTKKRKRIEGATPAKDTLLSAL